MKPKDGQTLEMQRTEAKSKEAITRSKNKTPAYKFKGKIRATNFDEKIHKIPIPACIEFDCLVAPPNGHLGCFAIQENPNLKLGDVIGFLVYGEIKMTGAVTFIEKPESTLREDMRDFHTWFKIHWVPIPEIEPAINSFSTVRCQKCKKRSTVINSFEANNRIYRERICRNKSSHPTPIKWHTVEIVSGKTKYKKRPANR